MSLSLYEKKSLFRFMSVYISSIFVIILTFSTLFYKIEKEHLKDKVFNTLRVEAFSISSNAIDSQMQNIKFTIPRGINYILLDKNKKIIKSNFKENIDLTKDFYIKDGCAYYIDKGAKGHRGIFYIVTKNCKYSKQLKTIVLKTIFIASISLIFLMIVGWYLARLFLKPMKEKIKELDKFIKDSTHELNTPITTMILALQKIEKKGNSEKYLRALKMSANLISSIYQDISFITFQKHKKREIKNIEIKKYIEKNINFFEILIEQKGLKISKEISKCQIRADENDLHILIKNLIDNAIKYSKPNKKIEIKLQNCILYITNEGNIDKKRIKEIFKRYEREDNTQGGFGIGLNIADTICKKYGFKISAHSTNGKITFKVIFKS